MPIRHTIAALLLASLVVTPTAFAQPAAPPADPPALSPIEAATLDFEDIKAWRGIEADTTLVATGKQSGRWTIGPETNRVRTTAMPTDVSWAEAMTIRLHLEESAPDASVVVVLGSENDATEGTDYWQTTLRCDFSGWKTFELPLAGMRPSRSPLGLDKLTSIMLASDGYGIAAWLDAGTVVHIDSIGFLSARDRDTVTPPEFLAALSFEDFRAWEGLVPDSEQPRGGEYSGRWDDLATNTRVRARQFPSDLTPYAGFQFWVKATAPGPVEFAVLLMSENDGAEGSDYYQHSVRISEQGWQKVVVPFDAMRVVRTPGGWDKITSLRLASTGYGLKNAPAPGTMVKLDDFAFLPKR